MKAKGKSFLMMLFLGLSSMWFASRRVAFVRKLQESDRGKNDEYEVNSSLCVQDFVTGNWTVTSLDIADRYPEYVYLSDFLEGPAMDMDATDLREAVCRFRQVKYWPMFPHTMQQIYRCWSWWQFHAELPPVLIWQGNNITDANPFLTGFLAMLKDTINLRIERRHSKKLSPYVNAMDTNRWKRDIEITDYAMLDESHARNLGRLAISQLPAVAEAGCMATVPKVAILNRNIESGRYLENVDELVDAIKVRFPELPDVPVVTFEDKAFLEQVRFFTETDILLSPHGAQLTGIPFLPQCGSVVEFFPPEYLVADYYGSLAKTAGIHHSFFYMGNSSMVKEHKRFHYYKSNDCKLLNSTANIPKVLDAIGELLVNRKHCCDKEPLQVIGSDANEYELVNSKTASSSPSLPTVDILSSGSVRRPRLHRTQARTIGKHPNVRNFVVVTERDDTDASCYSNFSLPQIQKVRDFCKKSTAPSTTARVLRDQLFKPKNHIGWTCAQKRPMDGLRNVLESYKKYKMFPDYLLLIDDDTYVNVRLLLEALQVSHVSSDSHVRTACGLVSPIDISFTSPIYGFGIFLSKGALQRLTKPIFCNDANSDDFTRLTCDRLTENVMGEKLFFDEGMSVGDLMYSFASQAFTQVELWKDGAGFCMHREHFLAYFFNFYHLSVPDEKLTAELSSDQLRVKYSLSKLSVGTEQCQNVKGKCNADAVICHNVQPDQIEYLFNSQLPTDPSEETDDTISEFQHANPTNNPIIDIISTGTTLKPDLLEAQEKTFGTHRFVRNLLQITEHNDTDVDCAKNLSQEKLEAVINFCNNTEGPSREATLIRRLLYGPKHHVGWLCAQRRPIDGLQIALQKYKSGEALPDYLILIDDDTFLNIDALSTTLLEEHPPSEPHLVAGCTYLHPEKIHFLFPIGGVGTFLTKAALQRLMQPIYCDNNNQDEFSRLACWRLDLNHMGEKQFFREGMSVGDLMHAFMTGHPFTDIENWKDNVGYCFHSDHTTGYFFNWYHLAVPDGSLQTGKLPSERLRIKHSFSKLTDYNRRKHHNGNGGECDNLRSRCNAKKQICHYTTAEKMYRVFQKQQTLLRQSV